MNLPNGRLLGNYDLLYFSLRLVKCIHLGLYLAILIVLLMVVLGVFLKQYLAELFSWVVFDATF